MQLILFVVSPPFSFRVCQHVTAWWLS